MATAWLLSSVTSLFEFILMQLPDNLPEFAQHLSFGIRWTLHHGFSIWLTLKENHGDVTVFHPLWRQ